MKRIWLALIIGFLTLPVFGQGETDAFRYSQVIPGGTARFTSMGGAFGALGGDFSSLSINPAGIAVFRRAELTISPTLDISNVASTFYGTTNEDMEYNLNFNNLGLVMTFNTGNRLDVPAMRFINFGFGINRHNNFNHRWIAEGFNHESSLMASFLEQAINEGSVDNLNAFSTRLAWDSYLLDRIQGQFVVDMPNGNVQQSRTNHTSGSIREFVATAGVNYHDRLFMGITVGLPSINFSENFRFTESDIRNQSVYFNSLEYKYDLNTTGTGFNLKLGAIYRVSHLLRLGAAFHTPTFYNLTDEFSAEMRSDLNLATYTNNAQSPLGSFTYQLQTPFRAIGSIALVFGQVGLISLDYEHIDFSTMRLRSDDFNFLSENQSIRRNFTDQQIVRIGGEYRFDPVTFRGGIIHYTNPFNEGVNDGSRTVLSMGFGFSTQSFFFDVGYASTLFSEDFFPYNPQIVQPISKDYDISRLKVTIGLRL